MRKAPALAALLALWLVPSGAQAIWPFGGREEPRGPEGRAARAAGLLSTAVRIRTDAGGEEALARLYVDTLQQAGIEAALIDTPGEGRAAAWARLPGQGQRRPVVLLSHLDVVPADPEAWAEDPYSGRIEDGFVHGRGSVDAKGVGVVHLLTLLALAQRDEPLERDVLLLATPDEEQGGHDGAGYIARQAPEWLREAEFLLTEGGSIQRSPTAVPAVWGVTVLEKSPCWLSVTTRAPGGHSSTPTEPRAIDRLVAALDRIRRIETPLRVGPEVARMFRRMTPAALQEDQAGYSALARALAEDTAFRRRFLRDPARAALVRNTVTITSLSAGGRPNVMPGRASAQIDARLLPGERCADFVATLERVVDDPAVEFEVLLAHPSQGSPVDTPLFHALERAAARIDPGSLVTARVSPGFTDAHWFRERGLVAYGFLPRPTSSDGSRGIHGIDERASIPSLVLAVDALTTILEELASPTPREEPAPDW